MTTALARRWTLLLEGFTPPDRALIGGKAWSIAKMMTMGLNVPPAFVVTTEACPAYLEGGVLPAGLVEEVDAGVAWLEARTGRGFGTGAARLLLSVRSGAAVSMPGMMDTVLNLGIDEDGEAALAAETGQPGFARDTHRRFHELYAAIVLKAPLDPLSAEDGPALWRAAIREASGAELPAAPRGQLFAAIQAVFESWNTRRARRYREHNGIPHHLGTAVTVQAMVFGNMDDQSGTGVLFSRNPLTGEPAPFGEYLPRAQGEDVVSGKVTPLPLDAMRKWVSEAHGELMAAARLLERTEGDVQDIEFTVQRGRLFLLQARSAKRAPEAAARIAVDLATEGLISIDVALKRLSPEQARSILCPRLVPASTAHAELLLKGEGACPGVAIGTAVADPDEAEVRAARGEDIILVRETTNPDDIHGMIAARGVVTAQGGATSHAAVVSRALGKPCVVGAGNGVLALAGQVLTIDGAGNVYAGRLPVQIPREDASPVLSRLIEWARARSPVQVIAPSEARGRLVAVDLDRHREAVELDKLPELLKGETVVKGAVLSMPQAAQAAYRNGVRTIVTTPVLPALLAILATAEEEGA